MPLTGKPQGRPRITQEEFHARVAAYCARYAVAPRPTGLPPFPTGRRETPQHREWIGLYKTLDRLARRARAQCERCDSPAAHGSVFCDAHHADARPGRPRASDEDREVLWSAQNGVCPICAQELEIRAAVDHSGETSGTGALLHPRCSQAVELVQALGPEGADRIRGYLWPSARRPRRGTS